jgi:hypothetical protein
LTGRQVGATLGMTSFQGKGECMGVATNKSVHSPPHTERGVESSDCRDTQGQDTVSKILGVLPHFVI